MLGVRSAVQQTDFDDPHRGSDDLIESRRFNRRRWSHGGCESDEELARGATPAVWQHDVPGSGISAPLGRPVVVGCGGEDEGQDV